MMTTTPLPFRKTHPGDSIPLRLRNGGTVLVNQDKRTVSGASGSPSPSTVQRSPSPVACPAVRVPELTTSPAVKGSEGKRRSIAAASSARQRAGLFKEFLPEPSSRSSPFLARRTLNLGNSFSRVG